MKVHGIVITEAQLMQAYEYMRRCSFTASDVAREVGKTLPVSADRAMPGTNPPGTLAGTVAMRTAARLIQKLRMLGVIERWGVRWTVVKPLTVRLN